jgi:hypothetical protein
VPSPDEELNRGEIDPSLGTGECRLEVFGEAAVAVEPGKSAFDDPAARADPWALCRRPPSASPDRGTTREITFDRRVRTGMNPKIAIIRLAQTMISYLR